MPRSAFKWSPFTNPLHQDRFASLNIAGYMDLLMTSDTR
jgi:hypothetical protein